jgi:hypothetical protein
MAETAAKRQRSASGGTMTELGFLFSTGKVGSIPVHFVTGASGELEFLMFSKYSKNSSCYIGPAKSTI